MFSSARRIGIAALWALLLAIALPATAKAVNFSAAVNYPVGTRPNGSMGVGDLNRDSKLDLVVANQDGGNVSLLFGNGSGGFGSTTSIVAGVRPDAVVIDDFNEDSKLDLAVANSGDATYGNQSSISILLGDGAGGFSAPADFPAGTGSVSLAVGDFNEDSHLDLAVADWGTMGVAVLLGDGAGAFGAPSFFPLVYWSSSHVAVGDFNGDSHLDLAVSNSNNWPNNVSILLGNGSGSFGSAIDYHTGRNPGWVETGDFNSDSKLDFVTANQAYTGLSTVSVQFGNGDGTFPTFPTNFTAGTFPRAIAISDLNGDGKSDLAVPNDRDHNVSILEGDGQGGFVGPTNFPVGPYPGSVAAGDFNSDSKPDLAVANYEGASVSILLNTSRTYLPNAARLKVGIVPAFKQCATGGNPVNAKHAPSLAFDSCNPPRPGSAVAEIGTVSRSSAEFTAIPGDADSGNGNQADFAITANLHDIRAVGGGQYASDLTEVTRVRFTDLANDSGGLATAADYDLRVPIDCVVAYGLLGSTCVANTTANAILPNLIQEQKQTVMQVFRVRIDDAGADGIRGNSDDRIFATQGLFLP